MNIQISEDDYYKFNQLRHRVGFIHELCLSNKGTPAWNSEQIAAIFTDLSETLDQISAGISQLNVSQQTSERALTDSGVDQE